MNGRTKRMWERHYTALGLKLRVISDVIILSRLSLARRRIEILIRKG
jgi:hypothetical protein